MTEWIVVGTVAVAAMFLAVRALGKSQRKVGELSKALEGKKYDLESMGKSLKVFAKALGKPTATGSALASRWRDRLRNQKRDSNDS